MILYPYIRKQVRAAILHPKPTTQGILASVLWLVCGPSLWKTITGCETPFGGIFALILLGLMVLAGYGAGLLYRRIREWSSKS